MRYCPYCQRLNPGRPQICYYCGRTWHVRLCPRGHENVVDAQYCGTCGSADLTETAGRFPLWIWLVRIGILVFVAFLIASLGNLKFRLNEQSIAYVVAIFMLLLAMHIALSQIPAPARRLVQSMIRFMKKAVLTLLSWGWEKIKNLFC